MSSQASAKLPLVSVTQAKWGSFENIVVAEVSLHVPQQPFAELIVDMCGLAKTCDFCRKSFLNPLSNTACKQMVNYIEGVQQKKRVCGRISCRNCMQFCECQFENQDCVHFFCKSCFDAIPEKRRGCENASSTFCNCHCSHCLRNCTGCGHDKCHSLFDNRVCCVVCKTVSCRPCTQECHYCDAKLCVLSTCRSYHIDRCPELLQLRERKRQKLEHPPPSDS